MVSEDFEWHEGLIVSQRLRKLHEAVILNIVVGHIKVDQALIHSDSLCDSLCAIISALIVGQMERLEGAILIAQIFGDSLTALECNLVGIQIKNL